MNQTIIKIIKPEIPNQVKYSLTTGMIPLPPLISNSGIL